MKKCAIFSCIGLGDGLITLVLSNNLQRHGYETVTFHPFLEALQPWFPHLPIRSFPSLEELKQYDRFFLMYERSPQMQEILAYCQKNFPEKISVLNPIATPKRDYPYWEVGRFDGRLPFADNLYLYCKNVLGLEGSTKSNGIITPEGFLARRHLQRVAIHPMSSRPGKNWPQEKFMALAELLKRRGFEPTFILSSKERPEWEGLDIHAPLFTTLSEMAAYVGESGYMVGNDSGIGHLASVLGLPTLTICRSRLNGDFWHPSWSKNRVLTPHSWIPNLKGMRLRDNHWKRWVSVGRVMRAFLDLSCERKRVETQRRKDAKK